MFDVGFSEVIFLAVLGLLILGPERLPAVARTLGNWVRRGRSMAQEFQRELEKEVDVQTLKDLKQDLNEAAAPFKDAAKSLDESIEEGNSILNHSLDSESVNRAEPAPPQLDHDSPVDYPDGDHAPIPDTETSIADPRSTD